MQSSIFKKYRLPKFKNEILSMAHVYLPSFITEYFLSIGEHPCWSDLSGVFLSIGGSKEDPKNDDRINEECDDTLTRFNTMVTCVDRIQIPADIKIQDNTPEM